MKSLSKNPIIWSLFIIITLIFINSGITISASNHYSSFKDELGIITNDQKERVNEINREWRGKTHKQRLMIYTVNHLPDSYIHDIEEEREETRKYNEDLIIPTKADYQYSDTNLRVHYFKPLIRNFPKTQSLIDQSVTDEDSFKVDDYMQYQSYTMEMENNIILIYRNQEDELQFRFLKTEDVDSTIGTIRQSYLNLVLPDTYNSPRDLNHYIKTYSKLINKRIVSRDVIKDGLDWEEAFYVTISIVGFFIMLVIFAKMLGGNNGGGNHHYDDGFFDGYMYGSKQDK